MRDLPNIRAAVSSYRWAIVPEKLEQMIEVLELRIAKGERFSAEELEARREAGLIEAPRLHAAARTTPTAKGGAVAVLPLTGLIMPKASMVNGESLPQGTSCEQFGAMLDAAVADPGVSAIVIDIDSPGGSVTGVPELAARIHAARGSKPIIAVANSLAASAAYWLGSAADELVVIPSGEVGSIGVFCVHAEGSEMFAKAGIKHTIIRAGEYKAEGNPYEPLSDEAQAAIQSDIDTFYSMFISAVAKHRGVGVATVEKNFGKGRCVLAKNAVAAGMADRIGTLEGVLKKLGVKPGASTTRMAAADIELPVAAGPLVIDCEGLSFEQAAEAIADLNTRIANHSTTAGVAAGAHLTLHDTTPALQGQEHTMPNETAPASPNGAAPTVDVSAAIAADRLRSKEIAALCRDHGIEASAGESMIERGLSVAEASQEILKVKRAEAASGPVIRGGHDRAADKPWATFGEQLIAIKEAYSPSGRMDVRLAAAQGMNQGVPSEGGLLVAPQFSSKIWDGLAAEENSLLSMTDNYTIEGESLTFLANAETSRATGSRFGGVRGYWINEADQITKSSPKLRSVKVEPQQLAVLVYVTEKLLNNSPVALEQYVSRAATEEISFLSGDAIVSGTGVGQPKGIMASGSMISVAKEASQVAATFVKANANKMWARLHPRARKNAVWLMNVDVEPQLDEFHTLVKNVAGAENVGGFGSNIYNAEKHTLKGRPIIPCEFCATLGTTGDVILADLSGYITGTRGGVATAMSMHVRFEYAEQAFRFMYELDGQPWLASALTPFKGSATLSTHVKLDTRA